MKHLFGEYVSTKMKPKSVKRFNRLAAMLVPVLVLLLVLCVPVMASAASGVVTTTASPSNDTPTERDTITVTINIDMTGAPGAALGSFDCTLNWDPAVLAYVSDSGVQDDFTGVVNARNAKSGRFIFNGANPTGATGDIVVMTITFDVVGAGTTALDLDYSSMAAAKTFVDLLPNLTINDGSVTAGRSPDGGGGGGTINTYPPLSAIPENGSVSVSPMAPAKGDKVTITPKPDDGFEVGGIVVTHENGKPVEITDNGDGTWTFTQPIGKVNIKVTFVEKATNPFTDVDITQWYYEGVDYALRAGLFKGTSATTFEPNTAMTRAMLVTVLHRLEGTPAVTTGNPFNDVVSGNWYANAVTWASEKGIVKGYDSDTFGTNDFITREQLATILYRYAQYKGYDVSVGEDTNILSYEDAFNISEYAIPAIQWACGAGIMQGDGVKLDPQGSATRAQVAVMLMKFMENVVKVI